MKYLKNGIIKDFNNSLFYYKNDLLHREDGPAIEYPDGRKFWFFNGQEFSQEQFDILISKKKLNEKLEKSLNNLTKIKSLKI